MKRHVICLGDSNTHGYCGAQEGETPSAEAGSARRNAGPVCSQRALGEEYHW